VTHRALIVCYYFPPLGLAGVGRPLNLFKHLPSQGWDCHVLTVKPVTYRAYEPELLEGLDVTKIFRAGSYDPQRLMYLAGWRKISQQSLESGFKVRSRFFPDSKRGWVGPAVRLGKRLIDKFKYDLILSTAPPMSSHLVGLKLHESTRVKWVADYRDYWTSDKIEDSYSEPGAQERARELLKLISKSATVVTAVNRSVGEYVGATRVISNGFDAERAALWTPPARSGRFAIGLLGTFGPLSPVEPLFQVIQKLSQESPDIAARIELIQVGNMDREPFLSLAEQHGLKDRIQFHGLQPRAESILLLQHCSCFFQSLLPGWGRGITSARIFDLLASGRPILAYADSGGEVDNLISATGNGLCFGDERLEQAASYLRGLISASQSGSLKIVPLPPYAEPYRWERIAGEFATLFNSLI
jgi:glycosyltransferase involved in cell wall biosynthesis